MPDITPAQMARVGRRFLDEDGEEFCVWGHWQTEYQERKGGEMKKANFIYYYNVEDHDPEDGDFPEEEEDGLLGNPLDDFETWDVEWL